MGRTADLRTKVLKALRGARHRYDRMRALTMAVSMFVLLAVPLSDLARVDLWRGQHALLFRAAPIRPALAGVIVAIAALYVITFTSNVVAGRLFCGWGCPVGQLSRFGEVLDTPRLSRGRRVRTHATAAGFGLALVFSFLVWWVDPRVLWQGSARALAWSWTILGAGTALAWAHGRFWRWEFCKSACPIGLYYSFVSPARWFGVHFRNERSACIECNACDNVCPVDLEPRDLMAPLPPRAGVSIADAPGRNHCLECGDCVRACEWMIAKRGLAEVPLLLGYYSGPQGTRAVVEPEASSAASP